METPQTQQVVALQGIENVLKYDDKATSLGSSEISGPLSQPQQGFYLGISKWHLISIPRAL